MQLSTRLNTNNGQQGSQTEPSVAPTPAAHGLLERVRWVPAVVVLTVMATAGRALSAPWRLALASVVLYGAFKFAAIMKQREVWPDISLEGWCWYLTVWPGMDLTRFRRTEPAADRRWLVRGIAGMTTGATLLAIAVWFDVGSFVGGWLTLVALLALVHFGWADVLSWTLRRRGFRVRRLFNRPERSRTLNDFWTRRWNVAFVEMDLVLFMPRLRRIAGPLAPLLMLLLSGILHELAISYPAGRGWGLPLAYFALHGAAMQVERTPWFRHRSRRFTTWLTRTLVLAPIALVFHRPFRDQLPYELLLFLKGLT